jgi:hypothetical protein
VASGLFIPWAEPGLPSAFAHDSTSEKAAKSFPPNQLSGRYTYREMNLRRAVGLALAPTRSVRIRAYAPGLCLLLSQSAFAFDYPLPPDEVREAYYLGQTSDREKLADFYKPYVHEFPYPDEHPIAYAESIEFRTAYELVVLRSQQGVRYGPFQADADYKANSALVQVRIVIAYRQTYAGPMPSLENFKFLVSQQKTIEPRKLTTAVLCNPAVDGNPCLGYRLEALLSFDARQFGPGIATVKVETPDGQVVRTEFDLDKLK